MSEWTEQIEDRHIDAVSRAFLRMNQFATAKRTMGHISPTEVIGDVYFILASEWTPLLKEYNSELPSNG